MRINRFVATKLLQKAIRAVYDIDDAMTVVDPGPVAGSIERAKDALHDLIDLFDVAPVPLPSDSIEARMHDLSERFCGDVRALLDLPRTPRGASTPTPGGRKSTPRGGKARGSTKARKTRQKRA
jgi:hypothetical protein